MSKNIIHYNDICLENPVAAKAEILVHVKPTHFEIPGFTCLEENALYNVTVKHRLARSRLDALPSLQESSITPAVSFDDTFSIKGWKMEKPRKEALVFVTGFNCSVEAAAHALAQMITLGSLAPRIKPFIFKWPGVDHPLIRELW